MGWYWVQEKIIKWWHPSPKMSTSSLLKAVIMWLYMAKGTLQVCLKILRWGDDPGSHGWPNVITSVIVRKKGGRRVRRGDEMMEVSDAIAGWWPGTKECGQPIKAGKDKEIVLPLSLQKDVVLLTASLWPPEPYYNTRVLAYHISGDLLQQQQGTSTLSMRTN